MGLVYLAGSLEDQSLRGMECSEIRRPSRILVKTDTQHGVATLKVFLGLLQKAVGFRGHKLIPSRRISCMRGERSRYAVTE